MRVLVTIFLILCSTGPVFALDQGKIADLITRLGDSNYSERTKATAALRRIGPLARKALEQAAKSDDPEIRSRAEELLHDVRYGINPDWPKDIIERVRSYDTLTPEARGQLLEQLVKDYGMETMPLLLMRIEKGEQHDADKCIKFIEKLPDKDAVWDMVFKQVTVPVNSYQADLLVLACGWSKDPDHIARAIESRHISAGSLTAVVRTAIDTLRKTYSTGAFHDVLDYSQRYSNVAKTELRLPYLASLALMELGRLEEADALAEKALAMKPKSESAHYTAGQMLLEMGQLPLAEKEWKRILEIPPQDNVYDINAYMRLGEIYADCDMYESAIEMYEKGLDRYKKAKKEHGSSMAMIGTENLSRALESLREKAEQVGGDAGSVVRNIPPIGTFHITIIPSVKNDQAAELTKELEQTALSTTVNVQPYGFRLFEKARATVKYDATKQELAVLLNDRPCTKPVKLELEKEEASICIYSLDMCYIYSIDRDTGRTKKLKSFEKDYTLKLLPGTSIKSWKESTMSLNGKEYTWQDLKKGVFFDYLPKSLEMRLEGTTAADKQLEFSHKIDPSRHMKNSGAKMAPTAIKITIEAK